MESSSWRSRKGGSSSRGASTPRRSIALSSPCARGGSRRRRSKRWPSSPTARRRSGAGAGVPARRWAEELIRAGRVRVDGEVATLGVSVDPARQRVTVDGRAVRPSALAWLALNKPVGYVVSRGDPEGRRTVYELLPKVPGLTYVGRLAVLTSGLRLLATA